MPPSNPVGIGYLLRELFTENVSLKVLSLIFALVLYALVHGSP